MSTTATDLLERATARPWIAERMQTTPKCKDFGYVVNSLTAFKGEEPVTLPDRVADCYGYFAARENAELIVRSVNSFEAMREALQQLVKIYCPAQAGYSDETIAAWINAEQALALAEGGEQ